MAVVLESVHTTVAIDDGDVATLVITNAGPLNLLNTPVATDVTAAISNLADHSGLRALVVRGSGDRAFIGGADIKEMVELRPGPAREFISRVGALCEALRHFPAPVVARLAGWCFGAGLEVAAACDVRISSAQAGFGMPEVAMGIPSVVHAALLPKLIGEARARWLMLTALTIDAPTALAWGLVNEVCDPSDLDTGINRTTARLVELGPAAVRQQKKLLRAWETMSLDDAIRASIDEFAAAFDTGEPARLMGAFLNRKRQPPAPTAARRPSVPGWNVDA
jgi:enoyl-CoA hydratase/carnithine racemase